MSSPPPALRIIAIGLVALSGVAASSVASATDAERRVIDYLGQTRSAVPATIDFRVVIKNGRRSAARFKLSDAAFGCEDGTAPTLDFRRVNARFYAARKFRYDDFYEDEGLQSFYRVRGELTRFGRARGDVLFLHNPIDSPDGPSAPECGGAVEWQAEVAER